MKKLLVFSLLFLLSIGIKAGDPIPPNFSSSTNDPDLINGFITFLNEHKDEYKIERYNYLMCYSKIILELVNKSSENMSYLELKKIIFDVCKNEIKDDNISENLAKEAIVQYIYCSGFNKFKKFEINAFNDKSIDVPKVIGYKNKHIFERVYKNLNLEDFKSIIFENIKTSAKKNDPEMAIKNLKFYQNRLIEMNPSEALKELKKFKVLIYPKIEDEEWKKAVVINELMIKSLE